MIIKATAYCSLKLPHYGDFKFVGVLKSVLIVSADNDLCLQDPMYVPASSCIEAHFWRVTTENKVWYEWCVTGPQLTTIHNPNGRSYWIGL